MAFNIFFYLGLVFMLIHEMDAIRCKEWRIFPGLSTLKETLAFKIFIGAHIPLFLALFWALNNLENKTVFIIGLDIFFILHIVLHLAFIHHKNNLFKDWISWTFIVGPGLFGILDIINSQLINN